MVFAHDADRASGKKRNATERRKRVRALHDEIERGFAAVTGADVILRIKATPLRMLEAWALGDADAVKQVAGKSGDGAAVLRYPEESWGDESRAGSSHPKRLLHRALGRAPTVADFAEIAAEADIGELRKRCPVSFAPFADEADAAAGEALVRGVMDS